MTARLPSTSVAVRRGRGDGEEVVPDVDGALGDVAARCWKTQSTPTHRTQHRDESQEEGERGSSRAPAAHAARRRAAHIACADRRPALRLRRSWMTASVIAPSPSTRARPPGDETDQREAEQRHGAAGERDAPTPERASSSAGPGSWRGRRRRSTLPKYSPSTAPRNAAGTAICRALRIAGSAAISRTLRAA